MRAVRGAGPGDRGRAAVREREVDPMTLPVSAPCRGWDGATCSTTVSPRYRTGERWLCSYCLSKKQGRTIRPFYGSPDN